MLCLIFITLFLSIMDEFGEHRVAFEDRAVNKVVESSNKLFKFRGCLGCSK